jgi:hypothetical protein
MFGQHDTERTFTVEKSRLETQLRENMAQHLNKVHKAQDRYQQLVIEELERRLDQAKNGHAVDPSFLVHLPIPQDYTKEYERALDRLSWMREAEVTLDYAEFNRYVRDEWEWNDRFIASNSVYLTE